MANRIWQLRMTEASTCCLTQVPSSLRVCCSIYLDETWRWDGEGWTQDGMWTSFISGKAPEMGKSKREEKITGLLPEGTAIVAAVLVIQLKFRFALL
jgi:hypothetical protein